MPFWNRKQRAAQAHYEPEIEFLAEQDGVPEQQLKAELEPLFVPIASVASAYLVRASFGDPASYNVVLCIAAPNDRALVDRIGKVFAARFKTSAYLDVMFLTPDMESRVRQVCQPFYRRKAD